MIKFLYFAYGIYVLATETAAAAVGLATVRKTWPSWYRLLVIMCCATLVSESYAAYLHMHLLYRPSTILYNFYLPIEALIIVYVLLREATLTWNRRLLTALLVVLPVALIIDYSSSPDIAKPHLYADIGCLLAELIASCTILIDTLQDTSGRSLHASPKFWLAMGILVSSCSFTVISAARHFMPGNPKIMDYYMPFSFVANTCMYGGIIKCFLLLKKGGGVRP